MDSEDLVTPEVAAAVAVTAVIASPQVRSLLRRGAVYGLAGVLLAGDGVMALGKSIGRGANAIVGGLAAGAAQGTRGQPQAKRVPVEIGDGGQANNGYKSIEAPATPAMTEVSEE